MHKLTARIRPEYAYNFGQLFRRVAFAVNEGQRWVEIMTPWGLKMKVDSEELHGRALLTLGVVDLRVSELIFRLLNPGDSAVDVGANIGAITSVMAARVGPNGRVTAFEPHPMTFNVLKHNVELWNSNPSGPVFISPYALSSRTGRAHLEEPEQFKSNSGLARLSSQADHGEGVDVHTITFDEFFPNKPQCKLVKIDVEGHEDAVVSGMAETLKGHQVENMIFEEFRPLPSALCSKLREFGYQSYMIDRTFSGLRLKPVEGRPQTLRGEPTNVVASLNPDELVAALKPRGWACLRH